MFRADVSQDDGEDVEGETEPYPWQIRQVPMELRRRVKAMAAVKGLSTGRLVTRTLQQWLEAGAPDEI